MNEILFYIVILLANIVQGITGFAGTILAMPPSLLLVGYDVAKPVLNVLGLLSGIYVFVGNWKHVSWKEFKKIVVVMAVGILVGIGVKQFLNGREHILYLLLGIFVVVLAVFGLYGIFRTNTNKVRKTNPIGDIAILSGAGIVHGIFVSGGPLLIAYLTKRIQDKTIFRATISTVWILLNSIILVSDISMGLWNLELVKTQLISIPFLMIGMVIGAKLYKIMSQRFFMILTYVLLLISGVTLLFK